MSNDRNVVEDVAPVSDVLEGVCTVRSTLKHAVGKAIGNE
uniref:Uncharacterized protein n=1 Tax=Phage sp. ctKtV17 TaxID=2825792 RepID=A0A8S5UY99_9VIRU|nr:MAG TPA: hypothetical protein [Phage sp. ctKtV17]